MSKKEMGASEPEAVIAHQKWELLDRMELHA
jgi:hypothetical protein